MMIFGWIRYESPSEYTLEHPLLWSIEAADDPIILVASPERTELCLIEPLGTALGRGTPADILGQGRFTKSSLFPGAVRGTIEQGTGSASCLVRFTSSNGGRGLARVTCKTMPWDNTIYAVAALEQEFSEAESILRRILDSVQIPQSEQRLSAYELSCWSGTGRPGVEPSWNRAASSPPVPATPPTPPTPPPLSFVSFTDPTVGGFTLDVPGGWQVRGGLNHPSPGDRRWFIEARRPDGITALQGDPDCPQRFAYSPMQVQGVMIPSIVGSGILNIAPEGKRLAGYYLKHVAPQRFGAVKITSQRDRPDMVAEDLNRVRQLGVTLPKSMKGTIHEIRFEAEGRIGCCFATSWYDPATSLGFMTTWEGTVYVWVAPRALSAVAEQVLNRMRMTFRFTDRLVAVVQQDERIIASCASNATMNQQIWFQGQQAAHQAQMAQGDAINNNYWQQQQFNDSMTQSYLSTQQVYDGLSQNRSDAMLDRQRLSDDGMGKTYDVPSAYNYYWRDQQSGEIVGTNTSEPPDDQRKYTELRKL